MKRLLLTALWVLTFSRSALPAAAAAHEHAKAGGPAAPVYRCPMHPWIKSEKPGKCTVCGMDLVAATTMPTAEGVVALAPSIITAIGVETSVVSSQSLTRTIRVTGAIDDDDTRHRLLTARSEGRVSEVALDRDLDPGQEAKVSDSSYRIKVTVEKSAYPIAVGASVIAEIVIDRRPFWRLLFFKALKRN